LAKDPSCIQCGNQDDTIEHTLFDCPFWEQTRREVDGAIRHQVRLEDVPPIILGPKTEDLPEDQGERAGFTETTKRRLRAFKWMVEDILTTKENSERERKSGV